MSEIDEIVREVSTGLKDPGAEKAAHELFDENQKRQRLKLCRIAIEDGLMDRHTIGRALYGNLGVWWPSLGPLTPQERTLVLREIRNILGIAQPPQQ